MEDLEYITKGALIMCDQGAAPDFFKPTFNQKTKVHGCLVATKVDFTPLTNIPSFKICKITQKPCVPATTPWNNTWPVKVNGQETLIGRCKSKCTIGGTVEFMTSGQIPLPDDAMEEVKQLQDNAQKELDDSGNGNSVGEAGFVEGMIPVWGSGRDMVNAIQTGDALGAVVNAGFLLWDVGSIVAGIFTFGGGTAAMQAGKAGLKGVMKAGVKKVGQKALQGLGKVGFKKLTKQALKKSMKELAEKIVCTVVRACFTGETLIHTKDGLKQIKDINIGDEVFSYNQRTGDITIRKVLALFEEEVNEILEISTTDGIIRTTRNHPFFVNGSFKDAEQISVGEYLFTHNEEYLEIISLNYIVTNIKVYNFEVLEDHCYYVGIKGVLVLNACYKKVFFDAFPALKGKVVVHHAVEQQVWKKWPGLFDDAFKNSLDNLRGIPKTINSDLHLSKIRIEWNKFYKKFDNANIIPTKEQVLEYAKAIDKKWGHLFDPPIK